MFKTRNSDTESFVVGLAEEKIKPGDRNKILLVPLRLEVETRQGRNRCVKYLIFLFHRPSGYMTVATHESPCVEVPQQIKLWELNADHDSTWRGDGVGQTLSRHYFAMCKRVDPSAVPVSLVARATLIAEPKVIEVVRCDITRDEKHVTVVWE